MHFSGEKYAVRHNRPQTCVFQATSGHNRPQTCVEARQATTAHKRVVFRPRQATTGHKRVATKQDRVGLRPHQANLFGFKIVLGLDLQQVLGDKVVSALYTCLPVYATPNLESKNLGNSGFACVDLPCIGVVLSPFQCSSSMTGSRKKQQRPLLAIQRNANCAPAPLIRPLPLPGSPSMRKTQVSEETLYMDRVHTRDFNTVRGKASRHSKGSTRKKNSHPSKWCRAIPSYRRLEFASCPFKRTNLSGAGGTTYSRQWVPNVAATAGRGRWGTAFSNVKSLVAQRWNKRPTESAMVACVSEFRQTSLPFWKCYKKCETHYEWDAHGAEDYFGVDAPLLLSAGTGLFPGESTSIAVFENPATTYCISEASQECRCILVSLRQAPEGST